MHFFIYFNISNLSNKIFLSTQSKALLRSNKPAQTAFLLSKKDNLLSTNSDRAKVVAKVVYLHESKLRRIQYIEISKKFVQMIIYGFFYNL